MSLMNYTGDAAAAVIKTCLITSYYTINHGYIYKRDYPHRQQTWPTGKNLSKVNTDVYVKSTCTFPLAGTQHQPISALVMYVIVSCYIITSINIYTKIHKADIFLAILIQYVVSFLYPSLQWILSGYATMWMGVAREVVDVKTIVTLVFSLTAIWQINLIYINNQVQNSDFQKNREVLCEIRKKL